MYKKEIINKMKDYFADDHKRINHALKVTEYAEKIMRLFYDNNTNDNELLSDSFQFNPEVITYAAILHDIGIKNAEKKYNSAAARYQEIEGPPVAREILNSLAIDAEIIDEVCDIIGSHHSPGKINTYNFKILYDADWLVNLPGEYDLSTKNEPEKEQIIDKLYLSKEGKRLARTLFLK